MKKVFVGGMLFSLFFACVFAGYSEKFPFYRGTAIHACIDTKDKESCINTYEILHQRIERIIRITYLKVIYDDSTLFEKKDFFIRFYKKIKNIQKYLENSGDQKNIYCRYFGKRV